MSKHRMSFLAAMAALMLAVGFPAFGTDATQGVVAPADRGAVTYNLRDVSVSTDDQGRPVVALVADGRLEYESLLLEHPDRLVVDLVGAVSRLQVHQVAVGKGGVERIRAGQYRLEPAPVSRVVFDLGEKVPYRIERREGSLLVVFGDSAPETAVASAAPAPDAPADTPPEVSALAVAEAVAVPPADGPRPQPAPVEMTGGPAPAEAHEEPPAAPDPASRAVPSESIERLLSAPALASSAEEPPAAPKAPLPNSSFETRTIAAEAPEYTGKLISLNLVDADVKQVFRLFHEISGLNFVLDPGVEGRVTIVLDNVPWDQALDIILKNNGLDKVLENNVIRIAATQKLATEAAARKQLKEAKELEVEPITVTRTLSYAKAKDVERVIRDGGVLTSRGKVIIDERTNTLIISDIPKKVSPLDELISTLDAQTPQVMIEARIVETSSRFVRDLGVDWGFGAYADAAHGTSTNHTFPHNASVKYGLNLPGSGSASQLAFKFGNILDSFTLDLALNALEEEGRGHILSAPKIATQNNERAEIEQGVRIPVVSTTATQINVEFVSASLRLMVTPQITAEGTIILDVTVENNTPDFLNRVGDVPPINTQRAQTKVLISDGGTTVIGGIFAVNEGRSETGVPWFRKIPGLGWLFKTSNITNENRELLIFITPKIMKVT